MDTSFAKIVALVVLIILGYLLRRYNLLKDEAFAAISSLVMNVTLPCVILTNLNGIKLSADLFILAAFGFLANLLLLAWAFFVSRKNVSEVDRNFIRLNLTGYSVGPFAVPYVQAFYPTTGLMATFMFNVGNVIMAGGGTFALIAGANVKTNLLETIKVIGSSLMHSGPLVAFVLVVAMSSMNFKLPSEVITCTSIAAQANTFLCMIMIGETINLSMNYEKFKKILGLLGLRWLATIVIALSAWLFLPFDEEIRLAITLTCLSPIPTMGLIYTAKLGGDLAMAANMSSLSVALSIVGMSLTILFLGTS